MLPKDLEEKLREVDSSQVKRQQMVSWILRNKPHYVRETLQWSFNEESEFLIKSCWILEDVCERRPEAFFKYMYLFFQQLPNIKNDSALRSCASICKMLCYNHYMLKYTYFRDILSKEQREIMTACCFDWLITDQKVACQASAMDCLYYLGWDKMGAWIYPELIAILNRDSPSKSAGYQARARKVLKRIT